MVLQNQLLTPELLIELNQAYLETVERLARSESSTAEQRDKILKEIIEAGVRQAVELAKAQGYDELANQQMSILSTSIKDALHRVEELPRDIPAEEQASD